MRSLLSLARSPSLLVALAVHNDARTHAEMDELSDQARHSLSLAGNYSRDYESEAEASTSRGIQLAVPIASSPAPAPVPAYQGDPWRSGSRFLLQGTSNAPLSVQQTTSSSYHSRAPQRGGGAGLAARAAAGTTNHNNSAAEAFECVCCATLIRAQETAHPSRCAVCNTINEPPPSTEDGLAMKMTGQEVRDFARRLRLHEEDVEMDNANVERDIARVELMERLTGVFASLSALSRSFTAKATSATAVGREMMDWNALDELYGLVALDPDLHQALGSTIDALLHRPRIRDEPSTARAFAVLLFAPQMRVTARRAKLCGIISRATNPTHHRFVLLLNSLDSTRLERVLDSLVSLANARVSLAADQHDAMPHSGDAIALLERDWQMRACARTMSLLFASNLRQPRLPLACAYVSILDTLPPNEIVASFQRWESGVSSFALAQYPFVLSLAIKMQLLSFDATRQMERQARDAMLATILRGQLDAPFLLLHIRRDRLVEDSLRQIEENRLNLKKSLRLSFAGEEGIDAGGLRKEWFLLLCRQLFDPQVRLSLSLPTLALTTPLKYGMFSYDDASSLCWFNVATTCDEDEFRLVGSIIGLAIYNTSTLDVPLPLAVYKKLAGDPVGLDDLAVFQPALARGLRQLLEYDGDVEQDLCRSFVAEYEAWGERIEVELCEGGRDKAVTQENRHRFVRLYVDWWLNESIRSHYDAFAAGFNEVTSGNALTLVRGEELELLVHGSTEPLDVDQLKACTSYEGYSSSDKTIVAFWSVFGRFSVRDQRTFLSFVTGSDRIPATGTSALSIKISRLDDLKRLPSSHTCFNQLVLPPYTTESALERHLRLAMTESEGFGLR